jgi:hypothetical protein
MIRLNREHKHLAGGVHNEPAGAERLALVRKKDSAIG